MKGVFSSELKPSLRHVSIVMTWISAFRFLDRGEHCALGSTISENYEIMLSREGSIEGKGTGSEELGDTVKQKRMPPSCLDIVQRRL